MHIFVNGIQTIKEFKQLDGLGISYGGLVFIPSSPGAISLETHAADFLEGDWEVNKVGVFADAEEAFILEKVDSFGLNTVLLHGNESPAYCRKISEEVETIKTFRIDDQSLQPIDYQVKDYDEACDYYLFENVNAVGIPNNQSLNYLTRVSKSKIEKPFFLAGDILPEDARKLKEFRHPDFFGIMLDRLFDKKPGIKDMSLILRFREGLRMV